jgi:DNA-binding transcriptional MerR regulator
MNELTVYGDKRMTAKQLAIQFGCSVKTIHNHANALFGPAERGFKKARRFNETETTAILESIKKTTEKGRPVGGDKAIEKVLQTQETAQSLKTMTLKEVAKATGAAYRTIADYAQKAAWTQNGKTTHLTETQVTVILEAMKSKETGGTFHRRGNSETLHNVTQGINTSQSRALRIAVLAQQQHAIDLQIQAEMQGEINELKTENRSLASSLQGTKNLLAERETGLSMIQRIAEAGGCLLTDMDDVLATYGRRI